MNFLRFYTCLVHFCSSTGGIIYNPVLLNSGMRKALYCGEYISRYEESPETGHFMDQQELQILKWAESCSATVRTPSSSASAQGEMAPNAPPASLAFLKSTSGVQPKHAVCLTWAIVCLRVYSHTVGFKPFRKKHLRVKMMREKTYCICR